MRQPIVGHRRHSCSSRFGLLLVAFFGLLFQARWADAGAAPASPSLPAGQAASQTSPPIPVNISKPFAMCSTRKRGTQVSTPDDMGCDAAHMSAPAGDLPLWTPRENCLLSLAYNRGDWENVQKIVETFLDDLKCVPDLNLKAYYSVLFLNEARGGPALTRTLIHHKPYPEIYGSRVGGFELYDIALFTDPGISVTTIYQASPSPNPLISQVAGAAAQAAGAAKSVPPTQIASVRVLPALPAQQGLAGQQVVKGINLDALVGSADQAVADKNKLFNQVQKEIDLEKQAKHNKASDIMRMEKEEEEASKALEDAKVYQKKLGAIAAKQKELLDEESERNAARVKHERIGEKKASKVIEPLIIGHVDAPGAFKRFFAAVVPQVTVTDQLNSSLALEKVMLTALRNRATRYDDDFWCRWSCTNPPCVPVTTPCRPTPPGPVTVINNQLACQYAECRRRGPAMQASLQLLPQDEESVLRGTVSLHDLNGNPIPAAAVQFAAQWQQVFAAQWQQVDPSQDSPTHCPVLKPEFNGLFTFECVITGSPGAVIAITATAEYLHSVDVTLPKQRECPSSDPTVPMLSSTSKTEASAWLTIPPDEAAAPPIATLVFSDRAASPSAAITAAYTVRQQSSKSRLAVRVQILDPMDPRGGPQDRSPVYCTGQGSAEVTNGFASGVIQLDPVCIGEGNHAALLLVDSTGWQANEREQHWQRLAMTNFAVGPPVQAGQASGATAASASACALSVTPYLSPLVDGLKGSQQFETDVTDLSSSYIALLSLATPAAPAAPASVAPLSTQYTFGKLTQWSFSLGLAAMFGSYGGKPAQVVTTSVTAPGSMATIAASEFTPNPPSAALTFVTADFHPWRYDETTYAPTLAERFRLFVGAAITPNAGAVAGFGFGIVRGLSLEAGTAFLIGNVLPPRKHFFVPGEADASSTSNGIFGRFFFALGYSFQ